MGYKQELSRAWGGFTNFAISFTIISVLAGTFTTFAFAWQNGGPIAASIGWPILCAFVLMVAFSMAELTSAYPTAGGPYWWAHNLGGPGWSWMTGWFNIVGLVGIVASVAYGAAFFLYTLLGLYGVDFLGMNFAAGDNVLGDTFILFLIILAFVTLLNIFGDRVLALLNNISVGWHVIGVAVIIALLVFVPDQHQDASFVFGERINNNGVLRRLDHAASASGSSCLPIGFLLAMYTQTGYDASAHTAEETQNAAIAAAQGVWRSVFFSALIGWFVLLAFLFAANDVTAINDAAGFVGEIFTTALDPWAAKLVILIATIGQIFCVAAGLTSASRTWYAFSRDRAIPGWALFRRVNRDRVPLYAVIAVSFFALVITIPALWGSDGRAVRVLRDHRDLHGRALPRLHPPGLPAAAGGRRLRARPVEPRAPLQARQHAGDHLRRPRRLQPRPSVHADRAAVERRLRRDRRQLHAAGDPDPADLRGLVPGLGQERLPRAGADARGGRGHAPTDAARRLAGA